MKFLGVILLLAALVLPSFAAESTPLRAGVDKFLAKPRILFDDPFGKPPHFTLSEVISPAGTVNDAKRREYQGALVRNAAAITTELDTLVKLAGDTPADRTLVAALAKVRTALTEAAKDKAKAAEATRQLAALR